MSHPIDQTWEELEGVRHESGRLMFKAELRRRTETGKLEVQPVRVWVPVPNDHVAARSQARLWFRATQGLDPERDKDIFSEMESVCLLARAIRSPKPPHEQLLSHEELGEYDEGALKEIQERINAIKAMLDPREPVVSEEQFWVVLTDIARSGTLLPLAGIVGHEHPSFIVRMAWEACRSPTAPSFARSLVTLTPEP